MADLNSFSATGSPMPAFYILVMDQYKNDPDFWLYRESSRSEAELQKDCYDSGAPHKLPRSSFKAVSSTPLIKDIPPCAGGAFEAGTIYGMQHV